MPIVRMLSIRRESERRGAGQRTMLGGFELRGLLGVEALHEARGRVPAQLDDDLPQSLWHALQRRDRRRLSPPEQQRSPPRGNAGIRQPPSIPRPVPPALRPPPAG